MPPRKTHTPKVFRVALNDEMYKRGHNQAAAGAEIDVTQQQVGRWLSGEDIPSQRNHEAIAAYLGVTIEELRGMIVAQTEEHDVITDLLERVAALEKALLDRADP